MKITGLLETDTVEALAEHLGNLDSIDKELVGRLMSDHNVRTQVQGLGWNDKAAPASGDTRGSPKLDTQAYARFSKKGKESWNTVWVDGRDRKTNKVYALFGQGSKLEDKTLKAAEAAELLATDLKYPAIIYKHKGKQALIVVQTKYAAGHRQYKSGPLSKSVTAAEKVFAWKATKEFLRDVKATPFNKGKSVKAPGSFEEAFDAVVKGPRTDGVLTLAETQQLLVLLAKLEFALAQPSKAFPKPGDLPAIDWTLVTVDETRAEVHAQKKAARKGYEPKPRTPVKQQMPGERYNVSAHDVHVVNLAALLKFKLNAIHGKAAAGLNTYEELLKHVIEKGYLNKIRYLDNVYDLDTQNHIDYNDLMLGPKGQGKSYIGYKLEGGAIKWSDPRHQAAAEEINAFAKSLEKDAPPRPDHFTYYDSDSKPEDERDAYLDAKWKSRWAHDKAKPHNIEIYLKHKIPPSELKVKLALDGGKIVPHSIEMAFDWF